MKVTCSALSVVDPNTWNQVVRIDSSEGLYFPNGGTMSSDGNGGIVIAADNGELNLPNTPASISTPVAPSPVQPSLIYRHR